LTVFTVNPSGTLILIIPLPPIVTEGITLNSIDASARFVATVLVVIE